MHFWRKQSFETLKHVEERLSGFPELSDYIRYLQLLSQGLRKEGLKHVEDLLSILRALPIERQQYFATVLCRENDAASGHQLLPHPIRSRFIEPVMAEWKRLAPHHPEPLRWSGHLDDLILALELDPSCHETRRRLIIAILDSVTISTHHLPEAYLGSVEEDLDHLEIARREVQTLNDLDLRDTYLRFIEIKTKQLDDYKNGTTD